MTREGFNRSLGEIIKDQLSLHEMPTIELSVRLQLPIEETEDAGEVVILKLEDTESEDEESYVSVDDDEVLNKVFEIFKEKFKDDFNFVD